MNHCHEAKPRAIGDDSYAQYTFKIERIRIDLRKNTMRLLFVVFLSIVLAGRTTGQTLHLLLVSDVEDARFGMISLQDEERMSRLFGSAASGLGYKMQTVYLNRADFTGEAVRKKIINLSVQPNDIIIFFYSGLGYYPAGSTDDFPFLQLKDRKNTPLSLDEAGTLLKAKGVRFCMAIADCRSKSLIMEPRKVPNVAAQTVAMQEYTNLFLKHLFLKKCGLMTITSAARNQNALVVTISEVDDKTLVELRRETDSAFIRLFDSVLNQMDVADLDNLDQADFDKSLQLVQARMPYLINPPSSKNRVQTVIWKTQPCEASVRAKITEYPTEVYPKNLNELEKTLNQLIAVREDDKRRIMIDILNDLFEYNLVIMQNDKNLSFRDYLENFSSYRPKLKKIEIENNSFREENLANKLYKIKIHEVWEP
ncbi:MAG: caspase family protein [Spirosomataceae bacterium]